MPSSNRATHVDGPVPFKGDADEVEFAVNLKATSDDRKVLSELLANVCVAWSYFERILSIYYAIIVLGDRKHKNITEQVLAETLDSITGWQTKIKLVRKAAEAGLPEEQAKALAAILARSEGVQRRRNTVVHGLWGTHGSQPGKWIRRHSLAQETASVYDQLALLQIANDAIVLANDLVAFMNDARTFLGLREVFERMVSIESHDLEDA